jgi:hypothetical protein
MGSGNADSGGGVDRPEVTKVTRLDFNQANEIAQSLDALSHLAMVHPETVDSTPEHYSSAFRNAAEAIRILAKQKKLAPLDDPALQSTAYRIDSNMDTKMMRMVHYGDEGRILCTTIVNATDTYELAHKLLRAYDELEGIK